MKYLKITFLIIITSLGACSDDDPPTTKNSDCDFENVVLKSDRLIGIDLLDLSQTNSFSDNLDLASDLGVEFIALHLAWTSIETSPNNYEDPLDALEGLNQVALDNNLKFSLTIRPIDIPGKTVPLDLENARFNTTEMMDRFKSLIDFVFTKVDATVLLNFQIGNEIDAYSTSTEPLTFWEDYGEFLNEMRDYIHTIDANVKVGFTGTFSGLIDQSGRFLTLMENVDILGVNYYPLNSDFSVREPDDVFNDINSLVATYGDFPIYIQEVGYQTSATNNSSPEKQAEFYCNFFKAWDMHTGKIKSANIVRLNDLSDEEAEISAGPYGISDVQFIEYLRTLGIRTYESNGINKTSFDVIKDNLAARGW